MDFAEITTLLTSQTALLAAIGVGTILIVLGLGRALTEKGPAAIRMGQKNRVSATSQNHARNDRDHDHGSLANAQLPDTEE